MNAYKRLANTGEYLQMLENDIQTLRCLANALLIPSDFNANIAHSPGVVWLG